MDCLGCAKHKVHFLDALILSDFVGEKSNGGTFDIVQNGKDNHNTAYYVVYAIIDNSQSMK